MNISPSLKPAIWGMAGGAVATIIVGFSWGGWITQSMAQQMETKSAKAAVVGEFTPLCVARARQQTELVADLMEQSSWGYRDFVVKAGWVDNVNDHYQHEVAIACANSLVEGGTSG